MSYCLLDILLNAKIHCLVYRYMNSLVYLVRSCGIQWQLCVTHIYVLHFLYVGCCVHLECQQMGRSCLCCLPLRSKGWVLPKMTGMMTANNNTHYEPKKIFYETFHIFLFFSFAVWISLLAFQTHTFIWKIPSLSTEKKAGNAQWSTDSIYVRASIVLKLTQINTLT